jgi:hypothetical protein
MNSYVRHHWHMSFQLYGTVSLPQSLQRDKLKVGLVLSITIQCPLYNLYIIFPASANNINKLTWHGEVGALALFQNMFCDTFSVAVFLGVVGIVRQLLFVFKKTLPYFLTLNLISM